MGRLNLKPTRISISIIAFVVIPNFIFSQTSIYGTVKDAQTHLQSVSVILKDSTSKSVIAYSFSREDGKYEIKTKKVGKFNLTFNALGYAPKTFPLHIKSGEQKINIDATLTEQATHLDEVIIHAEGPIRVRKDTINFKTKYFVNGTEQTVEDLLKKIPGLQVDSEGTIKVGNQEIEKLMIDGDDLFERGYKILSKNMPAYPIEEVEVLKNYSNNRLLKDVEESNKVALNLKLDEKYKRIWFGNFEIGIGNDSFYQLKGNIMNFGKKNKYYFLTHLNSVGYDATGDINHLVRPMRYNEPASIGDNQSLYSLLSLSPSQLSFKRSRTNFNNAELVSLNAIYNPTDKLKIKTLAFFNWDETDFFKNSSSQVNVNATNFTNTEDYKLQNKKRLAFGKLDFIYNSSKTKMLEATTKYNKGDFNDSSNLVFNCNSTIEDLQHRNTLFDQKISYTNKFKDKKVFLITGRVIDEKAPKVYRLNQFFYDDLFPTTTANNITQENTNRLQFAGVEAHLLDRKKNGHLLELQLGNAYRKDKLQTAFSLLENDEILDQPNDYQNQTTYAVNDLYLKTKYRIKHKAISVIGSLEGHQLFNSLENKSSFSKQSPFYVNPSVSLEWEINDDNKVDIGYAYNTTNAKVLDVYSDLILVGFRSFSKGMPSFNQLEASGLTLNYQLGNWSDRFFANTFVSYNKSHDFFSTNSTLNQNYTQSEKILIKDREFITINSNIDYYFKLISSNLKLNLGYSKTEFKNIVNNSDLREIASNNYTYGLELRSGFKGIFNYHLGTNWTTSHVETTTTNSFTNTVSFLDVSLVFNPKFDVQLQSERYYFGNLQSNNTYYFLDLEARYKLIKNKLTLGLAGKNLFNTKRFVTYSVSDIGTATTAFQLLPRMLLFKLEYRL